MTHITGHNTGGDTMAGVSRPATVGRGTSPYRRNSPDAPKDGGASDITVTIGDSRKAARKRKNFKRKQSRRRRAAARALPPVLGLSKAQFVNLTGGTSEEYDAYAEKFIAGAKRAGRRYEFPLEPRRV